MSPGSGTGTPATGATSYATVADLREYLPQAPTGAVEDAKLQDALDEATDTINNYLGFSFAAYGVAAARDVRQPGTSEYLYLPAYQAGSITAVAEVTSKATTSEATEAITDYVADELERPYRLFRGVGWTKDHWYRVTASWGYGEAPAAVQRICKEVAVTMYLTRDRGSLAQGVEGGGAVVRPYALSSDQRGRLDQVRTQYGEWGVA